MKLNRDDVIENFRDAVLFALDQCAAETFRGAKLPAQPGATDAELPALFKAIDDQAEALAARYGVELVEEAR